MTPGIQVPCFLFIDHPYECKFLFTPPPSTFIKLPPNSISQLSTLSPFNSQRFVQQWDLNASAQQYNYSTFALQRSSSAAHDAHQILFSPSSALLLRQSALFLSLPHITRIVRVKASALKHITFRNYSNVPSRHAGSGRQGPQSLACLASGAMS